MKKLLTILILTISLNSFSQTLTKEDSLAASKYIDSLEKRTSILEFKLWCDANATGTKKDFETLQGFYNLYINQKFQLWLQERKTKPKNK
jgi:hypothetical protein